MFKILVTFFICLTVITSYKVSDFKPSILKASKPSGYYSVETGAQTQGEILCFGDINGDQYTDYIAVNNRSSLKLLIYFWSDSRSQFSVDTLFLDQQKDLIEQIEQVMLSKRWDNIGDLSSDGVLDIIITFSNLNTNSTNKTYSTIAYRTSNCGYLQCSYVYHPLNNSGMDNMTAPPSLINFNGVKPGFLIFEGNQRYISLQQDGSVLYAKKKFSEYMNGDNLPYYFNEVQKHYASNIDFDGDCNTDLAILSINNAGQDTLQFYSKQTNSKLKLVKQISFGNKNVQFLTFVDVDASGTVDIVLIMGVVGKQNIHVIYNANKEPKQLCHKNSIFPFNTSTIRPMVIPYSISAHGTLILGDINSDSYPDLMTIVTVNDFRKAVLFKNVQIDGERQFKQAADLNANLIFEAKNPRQVAFFDLGEDGKLDIFVMVEESKYTDGSTVITRTCFLNNVKDDTLFIKILPLSQSSEYEIGSNKLSNAFGITMQWRITKLDGNKKISLLNQKSQWNYGTLQLPYVCGGLGRTNNYVQDLTVGYEGAGQKTSWSPIIPDSKLLVYEQSGQWKLQTLLTNSQRVNQVIYVSVVILVILGLVIFFLNYLENKQDRRDQYNFIQLIR